MIRIAAPTGGDIARTSIDCPRQPIRTHACRALAEVVAVSRQVARCWHDRAMNDAAAEFLVRSAEGPAELSLTAIGGPHQAYRLGVTSGLMAGAAEVSVSREVITDFFQRMADDWRGWDGDRELVFVAPGPAYSLPIAKVTASADGLGHVTLRCEVGNPWIPTRFPQPHDTHIGPGALTQPSAWAVEVLIKVEAGALDQLAIAAAALPYDSRGGW